jgi:hypothetical protein
VGLTIPASIIIPDNQSRLLYNIEPVEIKYTDMTSIVAWYELAVKKNPGLDMFAFKDKDMFWKYYYISLGLLEYSLSIVYGDEGGGKSLVIAYLVREFVRLFGKHAVIDWTPPRPELFGDFNTVDDEDFVDRIQNEQNRLAKLEKTLKGESLSQADKEGLITFNSVFGLDEGDSYADKSHRTRFSQLLGKMVRRRRHIYMCMFMAFVDIKDADVRMLASRCTHEIECHRNWFPDVMPNWCNYIIKDVRKNGTGQQKWLHLNPMLYGEDGAGLWRSHNMVYLTHDIQVDLGSTKKHKEKERV